MNKFQSKELIIRNEIDLEEVDVNSKKQFDISLTNKTNKVFEVAKVYTSCGCTQIAEKNGSTPFTIQPKSIININFVFDPASMHQKGDDFDHEIYFLVTRPYEKEYKIKITGKVI